MKRHKYIIIGGGLAGQRACAGIRRVDKEGSIALVSAEVHLPYERPPLSKGYLMGKEGLDHVIIKGEDYYEEQGIALLQGIAALALHPQAHTVELEDGLTLGYDKLLLATGGGGVRLPIPGNDLPGVFVLRTIGDADAIREAASAGGRAVVLGGSFLGSEVAAALLTLGLEVTMVFPEERLLQRVLTEEPGAHLRAIYEQRGARILSGHKPASIEGRAGVERVVLQDGTVLPADLLVMCVGIRLNTDLARDAGLQMAERGAVSVDAYLRTSDPDVYAVGDIASWPSSRFSASLRVEHWDVARQQGTRAGRNMAGDEKRYVALPYFYSDIFHLNMEAWGQITWDRTVVRGEVDADRFAVYYFDAGRLNGVLAVGRPESEQDAMQALVKAGPMWDQVADKLADETVDLGELTA